MLLLLVDDTRELAFHVESALAPYQAQIECAHSPGTLEAALGSTAPYDLILVNLTETVAGWDLPARLRQSTHAAFTVVVFDPHAPARVEPFSSLSQCRKVARPSSPTLFGWLFKKVAAECTGFPFPRLLAAQTDTGCSETIIGKSKKMLDVLAVVSKVAASNANVCIVGESGTGKELIARAVHYGGARRDRPLVTLDCPAVPEGLMESHLFGHVKGAFTGAVDHREGVFALAHTGTLFIDELCELGLPLQAKLLRVPAAGRLGGHHGITAPAAGRLRLLGLVVLLCAAAGMSSLAPGTCAAEQGQLSSEGRSVIAFKDERLTVRVQDIRLERLLEEISRLSKVAILTERGAGRERVSVQFDGLPLDEALRRLLQDHDAFFFYGVERDRPASLRVVWVYPRGRGRGLMPVPPEAWASTKELEGELRDADPATRGRAVETLVKRKGENARDVVLRALADPDEKVRSRALYSALRARLNFPAELLTRLALEDSSSHVRVLALEALETQPAVIGPIAARAMRDPDPHVRNKAGEILSKLDRAARRARAPGRSGPVPAPDD